MPATSILIKSASSACNINCSYCFYKKLSAKRDEKFLGMMTYETLKKLDTEIAKKLDDATKIIEQRVDEFIETVTQKQIEKIRIPEKTSSWSNEVNFIPITEFIGKRFEELTTKKIYNGDFEKVRYGSDAKYSMAEKYIKEYLDKTLSAQVSEMIKKAQKEGIMSASVEECISILEKGGCIKEAFEKGHKLVKSKSRELVQMFEKSAVFSDAANEIIGLFEAMLPKV